MHFGRVRGQALPRVEAEKVRRSGLQILPGACPVPPPGALGPGRSPVGFRPFPPEERAPPGAAQAASPERRLKTGKALIASFLKMG